MPAAVLCIGTELTRGEIINTNASWLAERLTTLGLEVTAIDVVDDDRARIVAALRRLSATHDVIIATGGLGPTTDDITSECAAVAAGVELARDEASLEAIRGRMQRFGRTMATSNEKQADFPAGATILPNRRGTAPGFAVSLGDARAYFLPGVPHELHAMFDEQIAPELAQKVSTRVHQVRLRTFGLPESTVNDRLSGIEAEHGVTVGYRAHFPEIEVKLLARAATDDEAARRARSAADATRARLGDVVFGEGDVELTEVIGALLAERGWRLGVAESCTGGQVAALFTACAGSSAYFAGGVVSYANDAKRRLLGVPESLIAEHGAVSEPVARAMAEGALRALGVEIALSLTGVAGPNGGTAEKPVGLVHFAVATASGVTARQLVWPGSRGQVQRLAAFAGCALVRELLSGG